MQKEKKQNPGVISTLFIRRFQPESLFRKCFSSWIGFRWPVASASCVLGIGDCIMPEWFGRLTGGLCFGSLRGNGEHLSRSRRVAHEKKRKEAPQPPPTHRRSTTLVRSGGHLAAGRRALVSVAVLCKTRISGGLFFFFPPLFSFCLFFRGQTGWAAVPETRAKVSQNYLNTFLETAAVQFK